MMCPDGLQCDMTENGWYKQQEIKGTKLCIFLGRFLSFEGCVSTNFQDSPLWNSGLSPLAGVFTRYYEDKDDKDIDWVFWEKRYNFQLPSLNTCFKFFQKKLIFIV